MSQHMNPLPERAPGSPSTPVRVVPSGARVTECYRRKCVSSQEEVQITCANASTYALPDTTEQGVMAIREENNELWFDARVVRTDQRRNTVLVRYVGTTDYALLPRSADSVVAHSDKRFQWKSARRSPNIPTPAWRRSQQPSPKFNRAIQSLTQLLHRRQSHRIRRRKQRRSNNATPANAPKPQTQTTRTRSRRRSAQAVRAERQRVVGWMESGSWFGIRRIRRAREVWRNTTNHGQSQPSHLRITLTRQVIYVVYSRFGRRFYVGQTFHTAMHRFEQH